MHTQFGLIFQYLFYHIVSLNNKLEHFQLILFSLIPKTFELMEEKGMSSSNTISRFSLNIYPEKRMDKRHRKVFMIKLFPFNVHSL